MTWKEVVPARPHRELGSCIIEYTMGVLLRNPHVTNGALRSCLPIRYGQLCVGKMRLGGALLKRRAALTVSKIKPNYFRASSLVVWTGKASVPEIISPLEPRAATCNE